MLFAIRVSAAVGLLATVCFGPVRADEAGVSRVGYTCGAAAGCSDACGEAGCCGCGRDVCVATVEKAKVAKHCWKIECDKVCVPKVVCPWDEGGSGLTCFNWLKKKHGPCCGDAGCGGAVGCGVCEGGCDTGGCPKPRCGKVIAVRDLKKETYECETCVCKWEVRRLPPCCGKSCGDGGCRGCGEGCGCGAGLAFEPHATTETELAVTAADRVQPEASTDSIDAGPPTAKEPRPWLQRLTFTR